jgi:hypothetical protein
MRGVAVIRIVAIAGGLSLALSVPPASSQSPILQPSFDCSKAATPIERAICADPELARLDGHMGQAFKRKSECEAKLLVVTWNVRVIRHSLVWFPLSRCGHLVQFNEPGLPAHGHVLWHCYRDAALAAGVDEFSVRLLMGHSLRGIS